MWPKAKLKGAPPGRMELFWALEHKMDGRWGASNVDIINVNSQSNRVVACVSIRSTFNVFEK